MKWFRIFIATFLTFILSLYCVAYAADDIVIDVVDGYLKTGSYSIRLADVEKPITIGMENGNVMITALTADGGSMRVNMGPGRVAVTRRANDYITVEQASSSAATDTSAVGVQEGDCPECGKPYASGDHTKLRCGHFVCRVGTSHLRVCPTCNQFMCQSIDVDHTPCPICNVGMCGHDDSKCYYRHNPAPTPFQTTDPDGSVVYFYVSPDGVFMLGSPDGKQGKVWQPAQEWLKIHATPSPSPTPFDPFNP